VRIYTAISALEKSDTMEERIGRIEQIQTDFFTQMHEFQAKKSKKIRFNPPDPPNPFSHCIGIFQNGNCWYLHCSPFETAHLIDNQLNIKFIINYLKFIIA
jgi:hypothetical protein